MSEVNPYATPKGDLEASTEAQGDGPVKMFSAAHRLGRLRFIAYSFGISMAYYIPFGIAFGIIIAMTAQGASSPDEMFNSPLLGITYIIYLIGSIAIFVIFIMLASQRFHDMNASGWWAATMIIPVLNLITFIFLYLVPGSKGANHYGNPTPPNTTGVIILASIAIFMIVIGFIALLVVAIAMPSYLENI